MHLSIFFMYVLLLNRTFVIGLTCSLPVPRTYVHLGMIFMYVPSFVRASRYILHVRPSVRSHFCEQLDLLVRSVESAFS